MGGGGGEEQCGHILKFDIFVIVYVEMLDLPVIRSVGGMYYSYRSLCNGGHR